MATFTSFLNLEKPTTSERLDVLKINSNWDKIDAGVSELNSKLVDVSSNRLTAGTNVTIDMQRSLHLGKIAIYNLVVTLSATKTRNAQVVSGCGEHNGGFNGVPTILATDNNGNFARFMLADGGVVIAAEDIPAGRWRMSFSYILN